MAVEPGRVELVPDGGVDRGGNGAAAPPGTAGVPDARARRRRDPGRGPDAGGAALPGDDGAGAGGAERGVDRLVPDVDPPRVGGHVSELGERTISSSKRAEPRTKLPHLPALDGLRG